ncbi:Predicted DNA-binding transcriptional regulator YafY, contains an HTH and WYL domains [Hymenobacter daecheongensis DSM 21074]|uniref:Predicted DNA-binding transcriptional regulator YafY, contains an HTH and WYL domains n=1 Tax=Hymenobacter daecheongensis DSM 21074 TaxID=1121955 RepID=A0A1M6EX11_9BACT|nr:YafY family protein [Hymenobacter daecheongensis]SHI89978.1 Predicted DNA-binding transcriptional regulator YafY, contains an HTH and WYL domains [Hymenobacter daecheongensis DSM 21074]
MNRFDRITAILIQLQARRVVKGQELAERYGVSLRTVYRDLRTLEEAGVPLCGEAGVGYSLAEGYRLPPVMFSRDEATALITAEKLVSQLTDAQTAQLSRSAMDKLRAVLRRADRDYLEELSPRITILPARSRHATPPLMANTHQQLLASIAEKRVVELEYRAGYQGAPTSRDVEPIGVYFGQYWHVVAFCRLRQEYRDFRLDRIAGLQLRPEHFAARPETLHDYWAQQAQRRQLQQVVVRFAPAALPHVTENKHHFGWAHEHITADGDTEMTFLADHPEYMARWLLLFAGQVRIVEPPALRQQLRELAKQALAFFEEPLATEDEPAQALGSVKQSQQEQHA